MDYCRRVNPFRMCAGLWVRGYLMVAFVSAIVAVSYYTVVVYTWGPLLLSGGVAAAAAAAVLAAFHLLGEIAKRIDVSVKISGHHVEVNLADLHGYEKHVVTTLLNESIPSPNSVCDHSNCRVIVVHDADKLSSDLQHYIGWFLGRYAGCNKIIFCCSDASNLEAIKHLCKVVTLQPPSFDETIRVLHCYSREHRFASRYCQENNSERKW